MLRTMLRLVYLLRISHKRLQLFVIATQEVDVPIQVALSKKPRSIEPGGWAELFELLVVALYIRLAVVRDGPV